MAGRASDLTSSSCAAWPNYPNLCSALLWSTKRAKRDWIGCCAALFGPLPTRAICGAERRSCRSPACLDERISPQVEKWFGAKKELAAVRTICSHIANMITGVKHGYEYKMKMVYAHFPINVACDKAPGSKVSNKIEIRNFLGEKVVRSIIMQPGVEVVRTSEKVGSPPPFTSFHPSSNPTPFLPFLPFLLSPPSLPVPLPTNTPSTPPWRCITQFCCTHCATCSP